VAAATEMCGRQVLAGVEYRVRIPQLPYDLLRTVPLPSSSRHQGLHAPVGPLDLHNMWIIVSTAGHRFEPVLSVRECGVDRDDCHYHVSGTSNHSRLDQNLHEVTPRLFRKNGHVLTGILVLSTGGDPPATSRGLFVMVTFRGGVDIDPEARQSLV